MDLIRLLEVESKTRDLEVEGPRESSNLSHALKRKSTSVLMLVPRKLFVVAWTIELLTILIQGFGGLGRRSPRCAIALIARKETLQFRVFMLIMAGHTMAVSHGSVLPTRVLSAQPLSLLHLEYSGLSMT